MFDISRGDLQEHFSGPSFLAWQRMGNLRGYAGPLPQSYIDDQAGRHTRPCHAARSAARRASLPEEAVCAAMTHHYRRAMQGLTQGGPDAQRMQSCKASCACT